MNVPSPSPRPLPHAQRGNLVDGPLTGHLLRMAAPMTWGIFAAISFQLVDLFFIALLGTETLAAVSFTLPATMAVFSLILGLAIGTSSVLSRRIGQARHDDHTATISPAAASPAGAISRLTTHALLLGVAAGLLLTLAGLLFSDALFRAMGAPAAMMPTIHAYIHTWFAGAVFMTVPMIGNAALRAGGNALFPAFIMTAAAIANAILSPLLIFGPWIFPALGVQGAALATVIVNGAVTLAALYMLGPRLKMIACSRTMLAGIGASWKELLMIGLPAGLTNVIAPVTNGLIIALLASSGAEAVAAFGIATRIEAFAFIVVMGLAGGMAPIIGQNWGARRYDRVHETLRKAFTFNICWSFFVALLLALSARPVAGLFSDNGAVIAVAALYFWIVPFTYAAGNLVPGWASAFNAIGAPERAALMILTKNIIVLMPAVMLGARLGGPAGIFAAIAATNLVVGIALHFYGWRQLAQRHSTQRVT